jgi:hypothetical protein
MIRNFQFENRDAIGDQRLIDRWHEWLWMKDSDVSRSGIGAIGKAALLGEASLRLSDNAKTVLGR